MQDEVPVEEESPLEPAPSPLGLGDGNRNGNGNRNENGNAKFWYGLEHDDVIMRDEEDEEQDENDLMSFF